MDPIMPEAVISLGGVPLAKYGTPGTMEVPDSIEGFWMTMMRYFGKPWGADLLGFSSQCLLQDGICEFMPA